MNNSPGGRGFMDSQMGSFVVDADPPMNVIREFKGIFKSRKFPIILVTILLFSCVFGMALVALDFSFRSPAYGTIFCMVPPICYVLSLIWCAFSVKTMPDMVRNILLILAFVFILLLASMFVPVISEVS